MLIKTDQYHSLETIELPANEKIDLIDHLGGFDINLKNPILDILVKRNCSNTINLQYFVDPILKKQYDSIDINFSSQLQDSINFSHFKTYNRHPDIDYKNFICSFNGSAHVSRKLLVSILERFKWFSSAYCSKNFSYSVDVIDGHISDFVGDKNTFYHKFFISNHSEDFFKTVNSFGHVRFDHAQNIYNLENKITQSFLHIVSETIATSYYPYVTEKFLYSVVTRGLFLAYAQTGWHDHLEKYYGFKKYTKLFDYQFDLIQNPIDRLIALMSMISKFSMLSSDDWRDLYLLELDNIEYNYDHYFSGRYLQKLMDFQ